MVDSLRYLQSVGEQVRHAFVGNKTILSFQEYMEGFFEKPRVHARDAARYIRDCFDFYGTTTAQNPGGPLRRFKLFDRPFDQGPSSLQEGEGGAPVCGHEEVQNAIYRILNGFVRAGRINKLILLHGPNGSAKSSIVAAIQRALEDYSRKEEGQLYRFNWIFPSEKLVKGSIGFGETKNGGSRVESYAHLEGEQVDARIHCELKDHPIFLLPRGERQRLLRETTKPDDDFQLSQGILEGELCHKCRQIYAALLQSYNGDVLKVLRHVQVERFYISRRYLAGAVTVEPQMAVDADYRQVTHDRSHGALPGALQNLALFEPYGPLVAGNRGVIEFSDLLKRPLEHYKYLLGTVETGIARMNHFLLHLDSLLIASTNEKHLSAFKEMGDFASFKGRIELVRVPYLRRITEEELEALTRDKSVYEFLQQEVVDGYHDHEEFVRVAEAEYLDLLDEEVRQAMGLVSEKQYRTMFERYVLHVLAWTRGERLRNPHTGEMERPDEEMMAQTESIVMAGSEDRREFRRGLIAAVGAHRLEHPEGEIDYSQIFPDLFRRLRDHFFDERKRTLRKNAERVLRYLGDERGQLAAREQSQVQETLRGLEKYGYCENCAKDGIVLLLAKRYTD